MRSRRTRLGAGALLGVMLLVVASATALGVYYADRADNERRAEDREAGRVFAMWFAAAHRVSMVRQHVFQEVLPDDSLRVLPGLLTLTQVVGYGVVPPGLPEEVGKSSRFTLGIIDDGSNSGVPMAFGVLEAEEWANTASLREGALEGGLAELEWFRGGSGSAMAAHEARIAAVMGVGGVLTPAPQDEALFVTADRGVRYRDGVVYRRAQPGHRYLNRMETTLSGAGCENGTVNCDVLDGGALDALNVEVTPDLGDPKQSTVGGEGTIEERMEAGSLEVVGTCTDAIGEQALCSSVVTTAREPGNFTAFEVNGESDFTVDDDLVVGSAVVATGLIAGVPGDAAAPGGDVDVTGHMLSESIAAGTARAPQDAAVTGAVRVTGLSTIGTLSGSSLTVAGDFGTEDGSFVRLYGPSASIGTLEVDSCAGCYPE